MSGGRLRNNELEKLIKTVLLLAVGIIIFSLMLLLLPVLLVLYLFLPARPAKTWFGTFASAAAPPAPPAQTRKNAPPLPASEDIIDVTAREVEEHSRS